MYSRGYTVLQEPSPFREEKWYCMTKKAFLLRSSKRDQHYYEQMFLLNLRLVDAWNLPNEGVTNLVTPTRIAFIFRIERSFIASSQILMKK